MAKKQTDGNLALEQQRVIVIPAHDEIVARKLRVAAYARVSSSSEDQLNSYRVQNQYYSELISNNPGWEMADIYADEGITGTSVEKREDFQRMMQDCRKGKIDRILVKSISRFARNTKDCLAAVRELKELGVSVQFEEQGIDTSKMSSEMVTAIIASLAQKGSESISGNVQWGYQKRMESGKFNTCKAPYGFIDFVKQTRSCLQSAVIGLGSPATISPSLMRKASVAAQELGCLLVANLNETRHERDICLERYGTTPTNLLEENGVLNSRTLVCGNLFTNHEERKLIRRHDTSAAVLARQSMLDAQITPFIDFLIDDVVTICGSGRCSVNMLQEIKALTISGKLESHKRSQMCAHDSFYAATIGAGRVLKIKLGQIEEGFLADLVLLDIEKPEHIPFTMPIGELVYSMHAEDVKHVIVNGKIIKSNGKLIGHHSKDILDKAKEALEEFWQYARDAGEI